MAPVPSEAKASMDALKRESAVRLVGAVTTRGKSSSENTLGKTMQSIGFPSSEATPHGFRKTASSWLNEQGFNWNWIERQLAHVSDDVRGTYNRAEYFSDRATMMQWWADRLDLCGNA